MCFKFILLGQVDKWNEVCQIDCMLAVEVNLGQLDRRLGAWSSGQHGNTWSS